MEENLALDMLTGMTVGVGPYAFLHEMNTTSSV